MKYIISTFLFSFLLIQCNWNSSVEDSMTPIDSLYSLVGAKHDSAMLLMNDIYKSQRKWRKVLNDSSVQETELILDCLGALNRADEAMMDWMRNFKSMELETSFYQNSPDSVVFDYLKKEEKAIERIHIEMIESLSE